MKSLSKLLGIALLVLLILVAGAGFALTHLLDPNDYKDEIRSLVRNKTGYDLQIDGEIGWSLFPWLGLELTDTRVARDDMSGQPFASVRLLGLSVRVMPLLRKEIRMSDIRIEGLDLDLVRDAQGNNNWEVPTTEKTVSEDGEQETQPPVSQPSGKQPAAINLEVDSLIVNSARLDYTDEQSGQKITLESVQISTGAIRERHNIPLKLSGFLASTEPLLRARVEMSGSAWLDGKGRQYRLEGFKLAGEVAGAPLDNKSANISASGNLALDLQQQQFDWQQLKFSINQLKGIGELRASGLDSKPAYTGQLSLASFNLREFLTGVGIELPAMQKKNALGRFELNAGLQGDTNSLLLTGASLQLDDSSLAGELGMSNIEQGILHVRLAGDQLNLDDYLPPAEPARSKERKPASGSGESTTVPPAPTDNPWDDSEALPLEALSGLNLDLQLELNRLVLEKLPLDNSRLDVRARSGKIDLRRLQAGLYGGSLDVSGQLDSKASPAKISLDSKIDRVPIEKLMAALQEEAPITGKLVMDSKLTTSGNSERQWIAGLNGQLSLQVLDGTLPDSNLEQQLCMAIATFNRKSLSQDYSRKSTPFTRLQTSARIRNGIAHTPDLHIAMPGLQVKGKGDLDLNHMGLDHRLAIILEGDTRPMPDPACTINKRYVGLEWPVHCRGSLANAGQSCRIDQDALGKVATQLAGDKISEKLESKLKDKVSPDLKDALKGLFKK